MVGRSACRRLKAITETYRGHVFADAKSAQCIDPMHPIEACHYRLLNVMPRNENQRQKHAWNFEAWAVGAVADSAAAGDAAAFGCIFRMPPLCCTHTRLRTCALCRALFSPGQRVASLRRTRRRL